jgi:transcriptional regulator with XRE-family HTH domain
MPHILLRIVQSVPIRVDREPLFPYVAAILARERHKRGTTQTALAAMSGISQSQVSKYLRAERVLDIDRLDALCTALGLDIVEVVRRGRAGARPPFLSTAEHHRVQDKVHAWRPPKVRCPGC